MKEARKLKPCPFCGYQAHYDESYPHHIYCEECGARVTSLKYGREGETECTEKWGTRQPRFSEAEREALERVVDNLGYRMPTLKNQDPESPIVVAIATVRQMLGGAV